LLCKKGNAKRKRNCGKIKFFEQLLAFCNGDADIKRWYPGRGSTRRAKPDEEPERSEGNPMTSENPVF
jgi:hypothetical protein